MKRVALAVLVLAAAGCTEKAKPGPALQKPAPLEPLQPLRSDDGGVDSNATYTVKPFTVTGPAAPKDAVKVEIKGEAAAPPSAKVVLLSFDADTYLAQVLPLLAALDDAGAQVWLQSPDAPAVAFPVKLRDEANFNVWLDEPVAGKLRIIQRSDGFELQTNMGKLPGHDVKGPTVPARGGAMDLVLLQQGLLKVKGRFADAPDVCFLPSYGTSLHDAIRAVASNWQAADQPVFATVSFVYPRPKAKP